MARRTRMGTSRAGHVVASARDGNPHFDSGTATLRQLRHERSGRHCGLAIVVIIVVVIIIIVVVVIVVVVAIVVVVVIIVSFVVIVFTGPTTGDRLPVLDRSRVRIGAGERVGDDRRVVRIGDGGREAHAVAGPRERQVVAPRARHDPELVFGWPFL